MHKLNIAIDFDGTVVSHEYPYIGKDIGAEKVLKKILKNGHKLITNTMRSGKELKESVRWFKDRNIELYGIQTNPTQIGWTTSPKIYADLYIDDAALGCPLKFDYNISNKPFVDWDKVEKLLILKRII